MTRWLIRLSVAGAVVVQVSCASSMADATVPDAGGSAKIDFDLDALNEDGLYGPVDGLRALHYEFCIPSADRYVKEVRAIDPSAETYRESPGRAGCTDEEYLVIGSTHQHDFRSVLVRLADLPYVKRIYPAHFE